MAAHSFRTYGHRGAPAERPENTLISFQHAVDAGVDALELDVRVTRDDHLVVFHDASGARTADVARNVAHATLAEVRSWDVGWAFTDAAGGRPYAGRGVQAPLLTELLEAFPDHPLNIDVKDHVMHAAARAVALVQAANASDRVTLTSVDHRVVVGMREIGYRGPLGTGQQQALRILALPAAVLRRMGGCFQALQIPYRYYGGRFDLAWLIRRAHALDMRVDYWTINDPGVAARVRALGADGVMTDDPARILKETP